MLPTASSEFIVPPLFDHAVVFIWAVSGAIVGVRKGFDIMGVAVVAVVSAVGAGLLRDGFFLQRTPPILTDGAYLPVILAATFAVVVAQCGFGLLPPQDLTDRLIGVIDALGTPAYAVIGMQLALAGGLPLAGVLLVGFVTAPAAACCATCWCATCRHCSRRVAMPPPWCCSPAACSSAWSPRPTSRTSRPR